MGIEPKKTVKELKEKHNQQVEALKKAVAETCQKYQQEGKEQLLNEIRVEWVSDDFIHALVRTIFKDRVKDIDMLTYVEKVQNARSAVQAFISLK